jgi:predicted phage tail protein|tara:strand:- start:305 stop:904 length:600 start_codon:yes stop_codon:yes gene_type:complete
MKVVKVYGALRKRLGQCRFEFDVTTPAQAIKALCVNFPGLDKWLIDSEKDGVGYRVAISKEKITRENAAPLLMPFGSSEVFSITPVVAGAGRGGFQIFAGLGLIAASVFIPGLGLGLAGATVTKVGLFGGALLLGGISQALAPQPEVPSVEQSAQFESFTFSNVVNTSRQGLPVPIAYGRLFVGSAVLSSGLDVDQLQT